MKNKKTVYIILTAVLLAAVIGLVCISFRILPTVNYAAQISTLLQPVLNAPNQAMKLKISAKINGHPIELENDVYLVTEDETSYLILEQKDSAVYIAGNILFLENGKAFLLGEKLQTQAASYEQLLPMIGQLYDALTITVEETDIATVYSVTVTGAQMDALLAAASLGESISVKDIRELQLQLTEKNEKLDAIVFSGSGAAGEATAQLHVSVSDFRVLASGDYPIPEEVKQCAAAVDPNELISLSEDLYRLVLALAPFADGNALDGTMELTVDCGPLQIDTQLNLSDLTSASGSQIDPESLQALPEMLGWLLMEGDISCTQKDGSYVYELKLDQSAIQELARMILPELARYSENLSEGSLTVTVESSAVTSMVLSVAGTIPALFTQIPIKAAAVFTFA